MLLYAKKMHLDDLSLTALTPTLMSYVFSEVTQWQIYK
ncbi:hypothetical protein ALTERO38_60834 [Alteromonas sp. 38]|nr:hypothetical protein ALTER154_30099 [Alteromonas sp. 154]VXC34869.1 hypothetical protein ALTERO38_60834 [Alteromonas sp. 38]